METICEESNMEMAFPGVWGFGKPGSSTKENRPCVVMWKTIRQTINYSAFHEEN